jgi:hypothetical protein
VSRKREGVPRRRRYTPRCAAARRSRTIKGRLGGEGGDGMCEGDGARVSRTERGGEEWTVEVKRTVSRRE